MRTLTFATLLLTLAAAGAPKHLASPASSQSLNWQNLAVGPQPGGAYVVGSGQIITPAGLQVLIPGRLYDAALSPDQSLLAVKASQNVVLVNAETGGVVQTIPFPVDKSVSLLTTFGGQSFTGILWSGDGRQIYCTDAYTTVQIATKTAGGTWSFGKPITLPPANAEASGFTGFMATPKVVAPGGLALDEKHNRLYVTLSRNNSLAVIDLETRNVIQQIPVGVAPFTALLNGNLAYVSNWGGRRARPGDKTANSSGTQVVINPTTGAAASGTVSIVDLAAARTIKEINVGLHPSALVFSPDHAILYVANSNSDSVSVIDTKTNSLARTFDVKAAPGLPPGASPTALAVSRDGARLYAAAAGLNAVSVIEARSGKTLGMIPVGWYPSALQISDSSHLFVANLKGIGARATDKGFQAFKMPADWFPPGSKSSGYNSHDDLGTVSILPLPSGRELASDTMLVARNTRLPEMQAEFLHPQQAKLLPVPSAPGERSVFEHVVYIIKENRTYDSVFGDLPQGNGDPNLCIFPRQVSPNHHALAEQFVLFDNLYCNGALSAEGHMWADQGITTDYTERSTAGFGRGYPFEGSDPLSFSPTGFIWDGVLRKHLTFRDYGEFALSPTKLPGDNSANAWLSNWRQDIYLDSVQHTQTVKFSAETALHTIRPYFNTEFAGFDLRIPDVQRAQVFLKEFHQFEAQGAMPNFTLMLLGQDHVAGIRPGFPTPRAMMADNDLALGQIVEAISKSQFWKSTVIFVVEDDPQSGLDHVDGRRTVGLVISPYTRHRYVDHTFYNQNSLLRTMELILGTPPMTHFDLVANPMTPAFQSSPDLAPYTALPNQIPLDEMNKSLSELRGRAFSTERKYAIQSLKPEYVRQDEGDEDEKNRIVWFSVKGKHVPYPKKYSRKDTD
jgi:YVTN family beta-propeller protein